jgi:hypothetical protein
MNKYVTIYSTSILQDTTDMSAEFTNFTNITFLFGTFCKFSFIYAHGNIDITFIVIQPLVTFVFIG